MRRLLDETTAWATERRQFGQPIMDFQGVSFPLAATERRLLLAPAQVFKTTVYYEARLPKAKAAAGAMSALFAPAEVVPLTPEIRAITPAQTMLTVVVGQTFHGDIAPASSGVRRRPSPRSGDRTGRATSS